jgi:hypothetical protein
MVPLLLNPVRHLMVRPGLNRGIGEVEPVVDAGMIPDNPIVHNPCVVIVPYYRGLVDIHDPDTGIGLDGVKLNLRDNDGGTVVDKGPDFEDRYRNIFHHDALGAPVMMGVVDLVGCQGDPSDFLLVVNPGDSSRIPFERVGGGGRRRPVPDAADHEPVPVVVGHISERLVGDSPTCRFPSIHRRRP